MQDSLGPTRSQSKTLHVIFLSRPMVFLSVLLTLAGVIFLPATKALADTAPGKPQSINGAPGNQQVSLSWGASTGATSYLVNETDLVSGQSIQLPNILTGFSTVITGLQIGHWYRFSITPVAGTTQGPSSDPIEIRTTGFLGSYTNYYAMGDSYSAGDGAPPYNGVTGCYRSTNSYAYKLTPGVPTPTMIACAGAVTDNIDKTVQLSSLTQTQLDQLKSSPRGNTLITLTIGGNDIGFSSTLTSCITSFLSCTRQQTTISQSITNLEPRLVQVYKEIRAAAPGADIIVVGYPLLVADPSIAHCHNPLVYAGLSASEMQMIRDLAAQLNSTIAQAASSAGIFHVTQEVQQAFAGHEACTANESQEWINEIAGLNDALHDSFHPNAAGYQAYADAIDSARPSLYANSMIRF
jgi:Lysophospholipase L1 and related esterases